MLKCTELGIVVRIYSGKVDASISLLNLNPCMLYHIRGG